MKLLGISRYGGEKSVQFLRQLSLHTGLWLLRRMLVPRDGNGARSRPLNNGQFYHWEWIMSPLSLSLSFWRRLGWRGGQNIVCGGYLRGGRGASRVIHESQVRARLPPLALLSYCIVSTPRCAVLEQVFSPFTFASFSPFRDGPRSLLLLCHRRFFLPLPLPPPLFLAHSTLSSCAALASQLPSFQL